MMRNTLYLSLFLSIFFLSSCNKEDDPIDITDGDGSTELPDDNGGASPLTNNAIAIGSASLELDSYTANRFVDVNSNEEYVDLLIYKDPLAVTSDYLQVLLGAVPETSKTLNWQQGSNAPGNISPDEFVIYIKKEGQLWSGQYSSEAWSNAGGELKATINGDKITLEFSDIELGDSYLTNSVSETNLASGKVTLLLSDVQDIPERGFTGSLVSE